MWVQFWTLFGAANQLLAALTLLVISSWLYQNGKRLAFTFIPMVFVLLTTLVALFQMGRNHWINSKGFDLALLNTMMSALLILLALYLVLTATRKMRKK
jgi:carbon starvation protein